MRFPNSTMSVDLPSQGPRGRGPSGSFEERDTTGIVPPIHHNGGRSVRGAAGPLTSRPPSPPLAPAEPHPAPPALAFRGRANIRPAAAGAGGGTGFPRYCAPPEGAG